MSEHTVFNGDKNRVTRVVSVLVNSNGNIPLGRQRANNRWALPKGAVDPRDHETEAVFFGVRSPEQEAAYREIKEEVGIREGSITNLSSIGVARRTSEFRETTHDTMYFAGATYKTRQQGLRPSMPDEIIEADFFPIAEAQDRLHNPTDREVLLYAYDHMKATLLPGIPERESS